MDSRGQGRNHGRVPELKKTPRTADTISPECTDPALTLGSYISSHRGDLPREQAARRSGLPESLWQEVEAESGADSLAEVLPAAIVAAMCVAVGADVRAGLELAGHKADMYTLLVDMQSTTTPLTRCSAEPAAPYIATPHVVSEALVVESADTRRRMAAIYRLVAESNWKVADKIVETPPDDRGEFWLGYAAAIRAVAEQQALAADGEDLARRRAVQAAFGW